MDKKQVCVLTSVHNPFDRRIFYRQARTLARAGYDVILVAPADVAEQVRDGVRVLGLPRPSSRWGRPKVWWGLLRQAINLRPDVIHFHDPELLSIVPLLRLALGRRVRIIYDVHEYVIDSIAHKVWIAPRLREPVAWLSRVIERALGRMVDGLIFVVEEQAPLYSGWRARQAVVHNYPDVAIFADPTPLPDFPAHRFRLIHLGSLYERRGIMTMLEALVQIVPHAPETLLILGGTFESKDFQEQVEAFIGAHNLSEHVILLGWIDHARLKDYLASADVAWLSELWVKQYYQRRAISTKLLECMLMGLPIVSSDLPDRWMFVDEAKCGFLATAGDPAAHAQAVLWLYRHPGERRIMGARGRQLVLDKYTWQKDAAVLRAFYEQLLDQDEN